MVYVIHSTNHYFYFIKKVNYVICNTLNIKLFEYSLSDKMKGTVFNKLSK